jgi:hypothetical protein
MRQDLQHDQFKIKIGRSFEASARGKLPIVAMTLGRAAFFLAKVWGWL